MKNLDQDQKKIETKNKILSIVYMLFMKVEN